MKRQLGPESGSSPLARGLPSGADSTTPREGIIPARAGFTAEGAVADRGVQDHPRSRGVYPGYGGDLDLDVGSSPLARGLHGHRPQRSHHHRIIPARAGFTCRGHAASPPSADHPRSRGVYGEPVVEADLGPGSSPLARGLPRPRRVREGPVGIIPARAGFTNPRHRTQRHHRDHPRSRGVYGKRAWAAITDAGSSPLARGLPVIQGLHETVDRIIPARAGFTADGNVGTDATADHPRSRGVYHMRVRRRMRSGGSSPLARGLPGGGRPGYSVDRIIPARAGFTGPRPDGPGGSGDHPRSRGVYPEGGAKVSEKNGSSPLARGLRHAPVLARPRSRIIPARAGFTCYSRMHITALWDHPRSRGVYACESLVSQRTRTLPDPCCLHCRPRARSAELR